MKHKNVDYTLSAVNYYLNHDVGYDNTCTTPTQNIRQSYD